MTDKIESVQTEKGAFIIIAEEVDYGKRLDFFITEKIEGCTRSHISELIKKQHITVNKAIKKNSYKIKPGDVVKGVIPPSDPVSFDPEDIPLSIIYEDNDLIILNKMAGVVVHPAPGNWTGTLVNGLLFRYPSIDDCGENFRPGIVHRLDKNTSGVMVVAKNKNSLLKLAEDFKSRNVKKEYLAIVSGVVKPDTLIVDLPIGRHPVDRKKMSTESSKGKNAETHFKVEKRFHDSTLLRCDIKTGRTHQIRVHCKAIGHPVMGDDVYSNVMKMKPQYKNIAKRQMLHSYSIEFIHPVSSDLMKFIAPLPHDMSLLLDKLESDFMHI